MPLITNIDFLATATPCYLIEK